MESTNITTEKTHEVHEATGKENKVDANLQLLKSKTSF